MTIDARDPLWDHAVREALSSLNLDAVEQMARVPAFRGFTGLCDATALGQIDARVLHRAWIAYAVRPAARVANLPMKDRVAVLGGYSQVFADDAAFPEHYIAFSSRGTYHLLPRLVKGDGRPIPRTRQGTPIGSWAFKLDVDEETVGHHLWPLEPRLATIVAEIAQTVLPASLVPTPQ